MGARKRLSAEIRKEKKKTTYGAKLYNNPTSPRKARLVAELIRGVDVNKALNILENTKRESAEKMRKLLLSAISNWQSKNEGTRIEDASLFVKEISIDGGRVLKRIRTAPQGRAARIRKRSNHIYIIIDNREQIETSEEQITEETATPETIRESPDEIVNETDVVTEEAVETEEKEEKKVSKKRSKKLKEE
jgi:large subunit ribosomal protein L22